MMRRRIAAVAALVGVWVLGWGELSLANVLSGVLVALAVLALFPLGALPELHGQTVRPVAALHLAGYFVVELVQSNISMVRDLLGHRSRIRTGIVAYPLRVDSFALMTFLANVVSLSPGTMPIEFDDAEGQPKVVYIHITRMYERDAVVRKVARYEELAIRAFGSREQLRVLEAVAP
jgi:multicomponent Na+:H+ antiporter subunit E